MNNKQSVISISINNLGNNCVTCQTVYLRAHKVGDRDIHIKVYIILINLFNLYVIK